MKKIIHKANTRGLSEHDWLDSKHNFSFANYRNPERVHFGALRVLNDDIIQGGTGFGKHPHDNMEIITIPLSGAIKHVDSMHHEQIIHVDEVQVMSAGTGIYHSEFNASKTENANFLQLWIFPNQKNVEPVYDQKHFDKAAAENSWQKLVGNVETMDGNSLTIHQEASISRTFLSKDFELKYKLKPASYGSFLFVVDGEIEIDGDTYSERDAIGLSNLSDFTIKANKESYVINIEVPEY